MRESRNGVKNAAGRGKRQTSVTNGTGTQWGRSQRQPTVVNEKERQEPICKQVTEKKQCCANPYILVIRNEDEGACSVCVVCVD